MTAAASVGTAVAPDDVLVVTDLVKRFPITKGAFLRRHVGDVQAVAGISFNVKRGETFGLVGESGCGKSTTARLVLRLMQPTSGVVVFDGKELTSMANEQMRLMRKHIQMVFQDPYASLNPRMTVRQIVTEPMIVHGLSPDEANSKLEDLLPMCGLAFEYAARYPHEFSGGQRQRIGIARALATRPKLIVLDEPVSALDVSIQAQIVNLLEDLQAELGLTYVFIAHDLSVIKHICDRIGVMYLGKIVETGTRNEVFDSPSHPYTKALLSAVPLPNPKAERARKLHRIVLSGELPSAADPPSGCRFRTRCWKATDLCAEEEPALIDRGSGHPVACHFPEM